MRDECHAPSGLACELVERRLQLALGVQVPLAPGDFDSLGKDIPGFFEPSLFGQERSCVEVGRGIVRVVCEEIIEVLPGFFVLSQV